MSNALVGYTGFVGSNLLQFYKFDHLYNSKNFHEAQDKTFDILFFCGVPAVKWYANKHPEEDDSVMNKLKGILERVHAKKVVLISTIDVYETVDSQVNEDHVINHGVNHVYGKNRYVFEEFIRTRYEDHHIVRLPALFGKGLKKNVIYDLIHNNNVCDIPLNSAFQWYYLEWLKNDIDIILKEGIRICNLFTQPIHTNRVIQLFKEVYGIDYNFQIEYFGEDTVMRKYDTCTKNGVFFGGTDRYVRSAIEVEKGIVDYLKFTRLDASQLCVSNICTNGLSQTQFACLLKLFGIRNVQIAPTKLMGGSWDGLDELDLSVFRSHDVQVYSFQSILYSLNHLNIFDLSTHDELFAHLCKVVDIAEANGVKALVFGCPRNRYVINEEDDNTSTFVEFFKRLGRYMKQKNVVVCLENNSKQYNCNYMNTLDQVAKVVRLINMKNVRMMADLGNAVMENDTWYYLKDYVDILYNVDVSHEKMEDFTHLHESNHIFKYVMGLAEYNRMVNLEMLVNDKDELAAISGSLSNFVSVYA